MLDYLNDDKYSNGPIRQIFAKFYYKQPTGVCLFVFMEHFI